MPIGLVIHCCDQQIPSGISFTKPCSGLLLAAFYFNCTVHAKDAGVKSSSRFNEAKWSVQPHMCIVTSLPGGSLQGKLIVMQMAYIHSALCVFQRVVPDLNNKIR